ncbi:chemotaxis protein [Stappia sp. GBMRC 2046]|uniref:Chemotaxis protein n=1 Tax=Stappia sediminis TaxID=2692190 RepID=A0A7X3LRE9_9HYPH|nr:rod-binding protein [Stappia sediminis]MXN63713.1 chemotaxis protein [Stappia sediminis]
MSDLQLSNALAGAQQNSPFEGLRTSAFTANGTKSIDEAAREFEAVFLNTMLESMFTGLEEGGAWGNGTGSEAWRGMLVEEYSKTIAQSGGIGIADSVKRELIALQETN